MAYVKVPPSGCQQDYTAGLCQHPSCCYCCTEGNFSSAECRCSECMIGIRSRNGTTVELPNNTQSIRSDSGHRYLPAQTSDTRKTRGVECNYLLAENPSCKPKCQTMQSNNYAQWPYCQNDIKHETCSSIEAECEMMSVCNKSRHTCESNTKYLCDSQLDSPSDNLKCYGYMEGNRLQTNTVSSTSSTSSSSSSFLRENLNKNPGLSENMEVFNKDHHYSPGSRSHCHNQVLAEIQCQDAVCQEVTRSSQHLRDAATVMDSGWPDRQHYQQELEAVRSQLRSLRNHSAIALNKEPCEGKRLRRESGSAACSAPGSRASPSISGAAVKRPRDISPKVASRSVTSVSSQSGVWVCQQMNHISPDSEQSDAALGEEDFEEEDARLLTEEGSASGSNTPSLVGETLGCISLSEPACVPTEDAPATADHTAESPLRSSLFSYVPPYVRFVSSEGPQGPALPPEVQRLLKWKLSPITPLIVRRTLLHSNFRLVRTSSDWCGTWGKHMKSVCFSSIKEFQKMNHFPGTFQIGRKDRLWRNLHKLMAKFGKKEFGFMPRTFVLPQDLRLLRQAWEKTCGIERWIVKPPASARGTGIRVVHKWSQIPKKRPLVVQRYIAQPYLINGSKFDLRLYVFVSSVDPLRVYLYDDGLVRFASVKYSSEMSSLHDRYMHLTNYSINKNSSQYTQNEDADACQGHKWTVKALWSYLAQQGVDVNELWGRLEDLVVKTLVSGESAISSLIREHVSSRYCCYELFGVDVLLDDKLRPWLLEVNISPSLHSSSPLDQAVKGPLVCDLLNMAGYHVPNKLPASMQKDFLKTLAPDSKANQLCLDSRMYHVGLSRDEANKQLYFTKECYNREDYIGQILQNLNCDDVRHLIQAEDELTQAGRFLRIFPTTDSHRYHQFFDGPRYYNMLFDAWESRYHTNRAPGIALLEELCQQKMHLVIPALSARAKSCADSEDQESSLPPHEETADEAGRGGAISSGGEEEIEEDTSVVAVANNPTPVSRSKIVRTLARNVLMRAKRQCYPRWRTKIRAPAPPRRTCAESSFSSTAKQK